MQQGDGCSRFTSLNEGVGLDDTLPQRMGAGMSAAANHSLASESIVLRCQALENHNTETIQHNILPSLLVPVIVSVRVTGSLIPLTLSVTNTASPVNAHHLHLSMRVAPR